MKNTLDINPSFWWESLLKLCVKFRFDRLYVVFSHKRCVSVSVVLSLPPLVGWAEYSYIPEQHFCFCNWAKAPSYAFFMIGCCFGIPFTVMSICNILIFRTVRASKNRVAAAQSKISTSNHHRGSLKSTIVTQATSILPEPSTVSSSQTDKTLLYIANRSPNNRKAVTLENLSAIDDVKVDVSTIHSNSNRLSVIKSKQQQKILRHATDKARSDEIRLALALAIVVIMFVVCWLPFCISMLIGIFSPNAASDKFHMWTLLIGYSNSCMNPVIYGALNKKFGEGFKDIFCRFCTR
ncbi:tyramine receptor Ser-2-like [Mytilus californianus]|uniref:tyramine receptor Ser-2-like n=1 Tax=Mytilus californianus TaxID=6549 RepID=UPI002247EA12|nr:tyramine receptor Ser-2-like [Mytilus californianus]